MTDKFLEAEARIAFQYSYGWRDGGLATLLTERQHKAVQVLFPVSGAAPGMPPLPSIRLNHSIGSGPHITMPLFGGPRDR